tara:strand:+ start:368 stop:1729 length:1362 start_codon:yes stop_codon:yes gene_type:complete
MEYKDFIQNKSDLAKSNGFHNIFMPDYLYDFQKVLTEWAIEKGRAAIFADCGLGKTIIQLVWAQNIVQKTNKPVLILTPLAVSAQTIREGKKFGIECNKSMEGQVTGKIVVTNYERLHYFNRNDFIGIVGDESSRIKNFDSEGKKAITEFCKRIPYRLLCTATAAPNDYIELGTSSEALGVMGYMDMLNRFFKNDQNSSSTKGLYGKQAKWRFKHHAENDFWKWVTSWSRMVRKPSDLGFNDKGFILPPMNIKETVVPTSRPLEGKLFVEPAISLREQQEERRMTIKERCEVVTEKVNHNGQSLVWCHLNDEGDLLQELIKEGKQIKGSDSDEKKERTFLDFANGDLKTLITKPKIAGFGLNFQNCSHMTFFPSHSWEQFYQGTRRCWRFGQKNQVNIDIVTTEGELEVIRNLTRKANQADKMFEKMVMYMNDSMHIEQKENHINNGEIPSWL